MGYSVQIRAEYKKYVRRWGADISLKQYFDLYWQPARYAILDDRERLITSITRA